MLKESNCSHRACRNLLSQWCTVPFNSINECRFGGVRIDLLEPLLQHLSETVIRNTSASSFNCSKATITEFQHGPYVHPLATQWQQNLQHFRQSRRIVRHGVCCWSSSRWITCTFSTSISFSDTFTMGLVCIIKNLWISGKIVETLCVRLSCRDVRQKKTFSLRPASYSIWILIGFLNWI